MTAKELAKKSIEYRKKILQYIVGANAGHTGEVFPVLIF
jgi:transketolase